MILTAREFTFLFAICAAVLFFVPIPGTLEWSIISAVGAVIAGIVWARKSVRRRRSSSPTPRAGDAARHRLSDRAIELASVGVLLLGLPLVLAWHPWESPSATTTPPTAPCGLAVPGVASTTHVVASGPGAQSWCDGIVQGDPNGAAYAEPPAVVVSVCDFYDGEIHIQVAAYDPTDATAFCAAFGTKHEPQPT